MKPVSHQRTYIMDLEKVTSSPINHEQFDLTLKNWDDRCRSVKQYYFSSFILIVLPKNQPQRPRRGEWATGSTELPEGAMCGGDFVSPMMDTAAVKARQGPWKPANKARVWSSKSGVCAGLVTQPVKILYLLYHCAVCTIFFVRGYHLRMWLTGHAHPPFLSPPPLSYLLTYLQLFFRRIQDSLPCRLPSRKHFPGNSVWISFLNFVSAPGGVPCHRGLPMRRPRGKRYVRCFGCVLLLGVVPAGRGRRVGFF
jgi:hypothetical protein